MDRHDEQFESYLRQFRLRTPGSMPEIASMNRRSSMRWALAAAAVILAAGLSVLIVHNTGGRLGPKATVEAAGNPSLYRVGEVIEAGNVIRSNSAVGVLLALEDGSRIEMRAQSELKLESAGDGIRVRLNGGSILVTATKQGAGHLYVQTRDAMVSVVGTVFLVNAEQSGTTVAVLEGEVHVQQGTELKKLHPGEQLATNPAIHLTPMAEAVSWSRSAAEYVASLQPAGMPREQKTDDATPRLSEPQQPVQQATAIERQIPAPPLTQSVLPFKVQANYVRITSNQVRTLITIQIQNRDLAFVDEGGGKKAKARIAGVIHRIDNRRLPGFSEDMALEFPSNSFAANLDQPTLYQESRYLTPGEYKIHITVEDKNSQNIGVQDYALNVPRIPDQELQASSMILAYSVTDLPPRMLGNDMFAIGEKRVKPNASGVFRTNENLSVWQEIYGLTTDKATRKPSAAVELVISQGNLEWILNSNITELSGAGNAIYTYSVPLGTVPPGSYDVQLKVTDNLTKSYTVSTGRFVVVAIQKPLNPSPSPQEQGSPEGSRIFYGACGACHSTDVMNSQHFSTKNEYTSLVGRERAKGAMITDQQLPLVVDYLFETYGKKSDPPTPQDTPVQRQRR